VSTDDAADNWNRESHPMKKNQYGVFEIKVPAKVNGQAAIPHNSKIKVSRRIWSVRGLL